MQAIPKDWKKSRLEMAAKRSHKRLPPVAEPAAHIAQAFSRLGMIGGVGMGAVPLSFSEIAAGAPWSNHRERQIIRDMSIAYLKGRETGLDVAGIPPWQGFADG